MTLYVALSGTQVIHGSIVIPYSGIIVADVVLSELLRLVEERGLLR